MRRKILMGIVVLLAASVPSGPALATPPQTREVLPAGIVPTHYNLLISPDADALTFKGSVDIDIDVRAPAKQITLNAADLVFGQVTVDGKPVAAVALDKKLQRATFSLPRTMARGRHQLKIAYSGPISRATLGFFAMEYSTPAGPRRVLATNFEPAAARQLLPCWDEPGRKASFTVALDAPTDQMALSNMPVARTEVLSPTQQRVHFRASPPMSTYLLFLASGDFERVGQTVDGVDVGVVVKRGDSAKAGYALKEAVALLHYYNDYFGVAYPLPKLDLIAAPGNITGAAMENWGAIFYSQATLLFDPASSTEAERQEVFLTVSHEMAHQWFGDLVTMAWWDDLWLNEGFARWMQTYAADALHPEWETGLRAAEIFEGGRAVDAMPSTHPVVQQVFTAEQAAQSFDAITYDKGAAIITMMHEFVGADKFREGVRAYMRAHAYGNTVDTDLWRLMQKSAGADIVGIERDFTRQEGVPLVRVTRNGGGLQLRQGRYALDPASIADATPQTWRLPLMVQELDQAPRRMLMGAQASLPSAGPTLVNAGQMSYARVLYDGATHQALSARVAHLQPTDQLGLINDTYALGIAGYQSASDVMPLIVGLPADANPVVWQRAIWVLDNIDRHYAATPQRAAYRRFALDALAPLARRLGSTAAAGEASNLGVLRDALLLARGRFGDASVIALARATLAHEGKAMDPRSALPIVAANSDVAGFDALLASATAATDPMDRTRILLAMAEVGDQALAARMVDIALSPLAPAGSAPQLLMPLGAHHADVVWTALRSRLEDPKLAMETDTRWRLAIHLASHSSSSGRIADLDRYQARNVPESARKPFLAATAAIHRNQRFEQVVLPEIDRWLAAR